MSTVTYKEIRAWGVENGYRCHVGKLGQRVIAEYAALHPDDVIADLPAPAEPAAVEPETDEEPSYFEVTLRIPGADQADVETLESLFLDLVMNAYAMGRAAERRDMLASLGVEA